MSKTKKQYACTQCGAVSTKWSGKCESCYAWNSLIEEAPMEALPKGLGAKKGKVFELKPLTGTSDVPKRLSSSLNEFDRVCGGGLVPGSVLLLGGDPGIGKSTLLLQVAANLSKNHKCVYVSGEEAIDQVRLRAKRLGVEKAQVELAASINVRDIISTLETGTSPEVLIIDSIQTMYVDTLDSAPGSVAQVRASAHELIRLAKRKNITIIFVGHVTKEGTIAGPRVLEHMVDAVLYFEGDRSHQFRILRSVKNRFGATDEIGVFEMVGAGLSQVENPSALFLADREEAVSGTVVYAGVEGTRPVLVEIQSLVAPSAYATPKRSVVGWDLSRLSMVLAVLESRCGVIFSNRDVYLNVAGGLKIGEPAADLAVAVSLLSSVSNVPVDKNTVVVGELGLGGEVRPVSQTELRLKESEKLGFEKAILPKAKKAPTTNLSTNTVGLLRELLKLFKNPLKQVG